MVSLIRIYADEHGESHFEDVDLPFEEVDFVPPAAPVLMSRPQAATEYCLERVPPDYKGEWHTVPQRVLAVYFSGSCEMTTSDGDMRALGPGMVLLAEDTTGKGHISRVTSTDELCGLILMLPD
jgi:hypothetical protein